MRWFWLTWFAVFLAGEAYGLLYGGTLSQVWRELREQLPPWAGLLLSVGTFGAVTWLFIHWAFSYWDRPGLDLVEKAFILAGALIGAVSFAGSRKRVVHSEHDDDAPRPVPRTPSSPPDSR